MLRKAVIATAILACAETAAAQDAVPPGAGEAAAAAVDFVLRPTQATDAEPDAYWIDQLEATAPLGSGRTPAPLGPPLLGPIAAAQPPRPAPSRSATALRLADEIDPFAPAGIAIGSFVLRPSVELGVSATDNVRGEAEGESAVGLVVAPAVNVRSEDERHLLEVDIRGAAILYGDQEIDERAGEARLRGRYDLTSRTSLKGEAGYIYGLDSYTDPDTPDASAERPAVHSFDAALGGTQLFGRFSVGLTGTFERNLHDDVTLADGGTASRKELDNTEYGLRLRAGYEGGSRLRPYVETAVGRRDYDRRADDDGFERSSVWGEMRGGLAFDLGAKLSGDIAVGYRHETPRDGRLEDVNAAIVAASILWSPQRLTEIRLDLATDTQSTSLEGATASLLYTGRLTAARRIGARFRLEAGFGLDYEDFVGADRHDVTATAFTGFSYAFSRTAAFVARYGYERVNSSDPDGDYDANIVTVRLRLQR